LFSDLDLIVRERDWARAHRLLTEQGFVGEDATPEPPPKIVDQAVVQEQKYWRAGDSLLIEIHYDDILYAGLAARDVEGFWQRARWIDVDGTPVRVMSPEDQLIHLCAHLHYDGAARLNWFSDVALIVRDQGSRLDWQRVVGLARAEEVQVPVYYSLTGVARLLGVHPPAGVLAALRPDRFRRWWHERYLPEAKVLSLDPMPRPALSFYFQPLFKRLLPDLLLMGRRPEKLGYLLRLLAPPRSWLRHYYRLDDGQPVGPHYVLHPLKLLHHYLIEGKTALHYLYLEKRGRRGWAWWCFDPSENARRGESRRDQEVVRGTSAKSHARGKANPGRSGEVRLSGSSSVATSASASPSRR
jgi:hypothetical protein